MKDKVMKNWILFMLVLILVTSAFTVMYLPIFGNMPQVYDDIIIERPAEWAGNKSCEYFLGFFLCFLGMLLCFWYYLRNGRAASAEDGEKIELPYMLPAALTAAVTGAVLYGNLYALAFAVAAAVLYFVLKKDKELCGFLIMLFVTALYAVYALYRIYAWLGGTLLLDLRVAAAAAAVMTAAVFLASRRSLDRKRNLKLSLVVMQLAIPFLLLIYFQNRYKTSSGFTVINAPLSVKILICALIGVFTAENIVRLRGALKAGFTGRSYISFGTCVSVLAFNRFQGAAIMTYDLHHPFENIIGFYKVFDEGEKLFKEYIPVSGMYSVFNGAFFKVFGNNRFLDYNIAQNAFYIIMICLIVWAVKKRFKDEFVFIFMTAFVIGMHKDTDYNRFLFILPIMLLLGTPKIIKQKNLWLKLWFVTSLFHGLYYPTYGVAVCAAYAPLGIWQAVSYIKSGELKKDAAAPRFWLWWLICLLPALLCIPLLKGTYLHIKAMAGQSIMADGMSRFGQVTKPDFLAYTGKNGVFRQVVFYALSFVVPAAVVWVCLLGVMGLGGVSLKDKKLSADDMPTLLTASSVVIMPLIAYTFTFVRSNPEDLYSRTGVIMFCALILLSALALERVRNKTICTFLLCFMVFLPFSCKFAGVSFNTELALKPYYTVDEEKYEYIDMPEYEHIGRGFVKKEDAEIIRKDIKIAEKLDKSKRYYAAFKAFGEYFITGVKSCGTIETYTVRGKKASEETVQLLKDVKPTCIISDSDEVVHHYYVYKWIAASGNYVWSKDKNVFEPNTEGLDAETVRKINLGCKPEKIYGIPGLAASELGSSMYALLGSCFDQNDVPCAVYDTQEGSYVSFEKEVLGTDADFLYLNLAAEKNYYYGYTRDDIWQFGGADSDMGHDIAYKKVFNPIKMVKVSWQGADGEIHTCDYSLGRGELLMPLGSDIDWMLNGHKEIFISLHDENGSPMKCDIRDMRLLKLRDIE